MLCDKVRQFESNQSVDAGIRLDFAAAQATNKAQAARLEMLAGILRNTQEHNSLLVKQLSESVPDVRPSAGSAATERYSIASDEVEEDEEAYESCEHLGGDPAAHRTRYTATQTVTRVAAILSRAASSGGGRGGRGASANPSRARRRRLSRRF